MKTVKSISYLKKNVFGNPNFKVWSYSTGENLSPRFISFSHFDLTWTKMCCPYLKVGNLTKTSNKTICSQSAFTELLIIIVLTQTNQKENERVKLNFSNTVARFYQFPNIEQEI